MNVYCQACLTHETTPVRSTYAIFINNNLTLKEAKSSDYKSEEVSCDDIIPVVVDQNYVGCPYPYFGGSKTFSLRGVG